MGCISCAGRALEGGGVTLTRKETSLDPIEAGSICPDRFAGLYQTEIEALPVSRGGEEVRPGDLFEVEGAGADDVTVRGDLRTVAKIGSGMTMGRLTVAGDVGPRLGEYMSGGEIVVQGSTGDWAGAHMSGGRIVVLGDVGDAAGAAYADEPSGMRGGTMVVHGSAGREVGARMRRGLVVVLGDAGESAGAGMLAGSVLVGGRLAQNPGVGMRRGTVAAFGEPPEPAPGFELACRYRPVFLQCYLQTLEAEGLITSPALPDGEFLSYVGDANVGGTGEVLVIDRSE